MKTNVFLTEGLFLILSPINDRAKEFFSLLTVKIFSNKEFQKAVYSIFKDHFLNETIIMGPVIDFENEAVFESEAAPKVFIDQFRSVHIDSLARHLHLEVMFRDNPKNKFQTMRWTESLSFSFEIKKDGKILQYDKFVIHHKFPSNSETK